MEQIHARFTITDEQKLYTLATLIFEGERIGSHLGFDPFTAIQREASWRFWRGVAEQMPLSGLPPSGEELWHWMLEYERRHWRYSDEGRQVVDRFFEDWARRWFPRRARPLARQTLLALPLTQIRPLPTNHSWMDYFGQR